MHSEITALRLTPAVAASEFPSEFEWKRAPAVIAFCHDWQGKNHDPQRRRKCGCYGRTNALYVRFRCRYRTIGRFSDADANGRRDELWERDVAEVFLQPDQFGEKYYKEFEVSPNGQWLDLDITPTGL